jgi:hypothetical protein
MVLWVLTAGCAGAGAAGASDGATILSSGTGAGALSTAAILRQALKVFAAFVVPLPKHQAKGPCAATACTIRTGFVPCVLASCVDGWLSMHNPGQHVEGWEGGKCMAAYSQTFAFV